MSASDKNNDHQSGQEKNKPDEFVVGIVTFILFLIFMTLWMFFQTPD